MTTTDNKAPPRDFWIVEENGFFSQRIALNNQPKSSDLGPYDKLYHVIEKSALDTLQAELDAVKSKLERAESLLRELESKIVFNSENQSKIDQYFAQGEK